MPVERQACSQPPGAVAQLGVERGLEGGRGIEAGAELGVDDLGHHLGVGLAFEAMAGGDQFGLQFGEVLDDAVMDHGQLVGRMRMRVDLVRPAMCRPARVSDADGAGERRL